jgi:hypothetical protein
MFENTGDDRDECRLGAFMLAGAICSFANWMLESCLRHGKA